jgi:hypothetical protein
MIKEFVIETGLKPSNFFLKSLQPWDDSHVYCECKREYFALLAYKDTYYDDEKTFEPYARACKLDNPLGTIIEEDAVTIYYKVINGLKFVVDCECNMLRKYEDFIWNQKDVIRQYLKDRIADEYRLAQEQLNINKLMGIN